MISSEIGPQNLYYYEHYDKHYKEMYSLPPLGGDMDTVTFSGFSSGSYMSHQMHIVYSEMIKGVGLHAGGPYGQYFLSDKVDPNTADRGIEYADKGEMFKDIDKQSNLKGHPVFIFSGEHDEIVDKSYQDKQAEYYEHVGADVKFVRKPYNHVIPVDKPVSDMWPRLDCNPNGLWEMTTRGTNFAENCGYNLAENILAYLYESLDPTFKLKKGVTNWADLGVLRKYDQREFIDKALPETGMNEYGLIYYPHACVKGDKKCKIHVYLHGCNLSVDTWGDASIRTQGYLDLAAANDIIVAFPQTEQDPFAPENGINDCWSHQPGSIGDPYFYGKNGLQNRALKYLVERISGERNKGYDYNKFNISHEE